MKLYMQNTVEVHAGWDRGGSSMYGQRRGQARDNMAQFGWAIDSFDSKRMTSDGTAEGDKGGCRGEAVKFAEMPWVDKGMDQDYGLAVWGRSTAKPATVDLVSETAACSKGTGVCRLYADVWTTALVCQSLDRAPNLLSVVVADVPDALR